MNDVFIDDLYGNVGQRGLTVLLKFVVVKSCLQVRVLARANHYNTTKAPPRSLLSLKEKRKILYGGEISGGHL
jgi:hypothetical protein